MYGNSKALVNWILSCLPKGAVLVESDMRSSYDGLHYFDLDQDGINEVFGRYRLYEEEYLFILKNFKGTYYFVHPHMYEIQKRSFRYFEEVSSQRTVYLFPAVLKEIGGEKWGFIDEKGTFSLSTIYDHADDFQSNDLAIVRLFDKSGLINSTGYFIVRPTYDSINPFSEGRATVVDRKGFRVINQRGQETTPKSYDFIGEYHERRALFAETDQNGNYLYGYLNKRGKVVIPLSYEMASDFKEGKAIVKTKEGKFNLIDLTGNVLTSYPYEFVGGYGQGMLTFRKTVNGKFGYMDEQGKVIIEPRFSDAQSFTQGRAIVSISEDMKATYGLISLDGKFVIKPNYHNLKSLGEGMYAIGRAIDPEKPYLGSKFAVANSDGRILSGFIYNDIHTYHEGLASASDDRNTFFINKRGERVGNLPIVHGSGLLQFDKTLIKGEVDYRLLYFDKKGELVWKQNTSIPLFNQSTVLEQKYKPNKNYLVYYPKIKGIGDEASVNVKLKELSGVKEIPALTQLESNYFGDFEITYVKGNLLVIEMTGYDYPFGAAHGMPVKHYAHINLKSGTFFQLYDLFKPGSSYVTVLSDIIADQIKSNEQYSYVFPDSYKGIKADQPFFISEGSLNLYFFPYEIAPYAAGFPTFTISFDEVETIINKKGAFWTAIHSQPSV